MRLHPPVNCRDLAFVSHAGETLPLERDLAYWLRQHPRLRHIHSFHATPPSLDGKDRWEDLDKIELSGEMTSTVYSIRCGGIEALYVQMLVQDVAMRHPEDSSRTIWKRIPYTHNDAINSVSSPDRQNGSGLAIMQANQFRSSWCIS